MPSASSCATKFLPNKPMQNSVAIYSAPSHRPGTRTPAPWFFRRRSRRRVDVAGSGLWLRHGPNKPADSLTLKKVSVSAVSAGQGVEIRQLSATSDSLTAKQGKQPHTCARAPACMSDCVCHVVRLSESYIYIYKSITYSTDTSLTPADTGLSRDQGRAGQNRCLSGWWCAHGGFYGAA
jgi:hypothetical protein